MNEHILINMKFTDKNHDTVESITVNLKDYFAEYGYIPRTEAIPIEWLCNYALSTNNTEIFFQMFLKWCKEKEHETN